MTNNQSNELYNSIYQMLESYNSIVTEKLGKEVTHALVGYCKERERHLKLELSAAKIRESELLQELEPYRAFKAAVQSEHNKEIGE